MGRGYLNRPELTAERFVAGSVRRTGGARLYRRVIWGDGGGRGDRVSGAEGSSGEDPRLPHRAGRDRGAAGEHAGVREAVVLAREDTPGDKRLVAYYTGCIGDTIRRQEVVGAEQLRMHLSAALAGVHGAGGLRAVGVAAADAERQAGPQGVAGAGRRCYVARSYEAPQGEIETKLAAIWAEVLKLEQVGRHDNFFDLGGHSLLAVRVMARLRQALDVEVAMTRSVRASGVGDLAAALTSASSRRSCRRLCAASVAQRIAVVVCAAAVVVSGADGGRQPAYHIPMVCG